MIKIKLYFNKDKLMYQQPKDNHRTCFFENISSL